MAFFLDFLGVWWRFNEKGALGHSKTFLELIQEFCKVSLIGLTMKIIELAVGTETFQLLDKKLNAQGFNDFKDRNTLKEYTKMIK